MSSKPPSESRRVTLMGERLARFNRVKAHLHTDKWCQVIDCLLDCYETMQTHSQKGKDYTHDTHQL